MIPDIQYMVGYNDGWSLAGDAPKIAAQLGALEGDDDYLSGVQHGINERELQQEYEQEQLQIKELENLRENQHPDLLMEI